MNLYMNPAELELAVGNIVGHWDMYRDSIVVSLYQEKAILMKHDGLIPNGHKAVFWPEDWQAFSYWGLHWARVLMRLGWVLAMLFALAGSAMLLVALL